MSKYLIGKKYNNNYNVEHKKMLNNKNILSKTLNLNNINNINSTNLNTNKYKNRKSNSCSFISESELPENMKNHYSDLSDDKLTIKTTLLKTNEAKNLNIKNDNEPNKYHINFELLSNAGINDNININMNFI